MKKHNEKKIYNKNRNKTKQHKTKQLKQNQK